MDVKECSERGGAPGGFQADEEGEGQETPRLIGPSAKLRVESSTAALDEKSILTVAEEEAGKFEKTLVAGLKAIEKSLRAGQPHGARDKLIGVVGGGERAAYGKLLHGVLVIVAAYRGDADLGAISR